MNTKEIMSQVDKKTAIEIASQIKTVYGQVDGNTWASQFENIVLKALQKSGLCLDLNKLNSNTANGVCTKIERKSGISI